MRVYTLRRLPAWHSLDLARALPRLLASAQHGVRCPQCDSTLAVFDRMLGKQLHDQLACSCGAVWPASKAERSTVSRCWAERQRITGAVARACLPLRTARDGLLPTVHDVDGWLALGITDAVVGRPCSLSPADPQPHAQAYVRGHVLACMAIYVTGEAAFDCGPSAPASLSVRLPAAPAAQGPHTMKFSTPVSDLAAALAAAAAAFTPVLKTRLARIPIKDKSGNYTGKEYEYKYADLAAVIDSVIQSLSSNGLSMISSPHTVQGGVEVVTLLLHSSGQWVESEPLFMPCSTKPQDVGSAITYARRYQLSAMLNIASEDDDGRSAHDSDPEESAELPEPRRSTKRTSSSKAKPLVEPEAPKPPADPWLTDAAMIQAITGKARELAVLDALEPGDVWRDLLTRAGLPLVIPGKDGEVKVDTPRKLRVSQAKLLLSLIEAELAKVHAVMQANAAEQVPA